MGKKQTSIEFLINDLYHYGGTMRINNSQMVIYFQINHFEDLLKQAKQMEKEQIEMAFAKSYLIGLVEVNYDEVNKASEQYYNETYGK